MALNAYLVLKGVSTRGANNWIDLKFLKIQPSEFAKPVLIITMGCLFNTFYKKLNNKKSKNDKEIWTILGISLTFAVLVFLQKDLGTAMILFGIFLIEFLFSPIKKEDKYKAGFASELLARCRYFQVERVLLNTEVRRNLVDFQTKENSFHALLCVDGCGSISVDGSNFMLNFFKGDCIFVPAKSEILKLHGRAQLLDVSC